MNRAPDNDTTAARPLRYTFPAAAGSVWLGLGWVSVAGLGVTIAAAVLLLLAGAGIWLVAPATVCGGAIATVPLAGRPVLAWCPTLASHLLARGSGADRWTRPQADTTPHLCDRRPVRLPVGLGPRQLRLVNLDPTGNDTSSPAAITHDRTHSRTHRHGPRHGRVTVVLEVIGLGRFGLLEAPAQDTELARWGSSLATVFADPDVTSVQWLTHTRPETRPVHPQLLHHTDSDADAGLSEPDRADLRQDYGRLVAAVHGQASRHRHLLALTLTGCAGVADGAGPDAALDAARHTATALLGADLLARPLTLAELGTELRLHLDPTFPDETADAGPAEDPARWLPLSTRASWDHCRTDDTLHRCYTVTGWPRLALTADWLAPLLHDTPPAGTARTLSVHTRPVPGEHAARRARASSAKARLDASDRSRLGFTDTAAGSLTDTLAESDAAATEAELLAGYRMTDLSALVTISAADPAALEAAGRQLRALAAAQHLDLRPLHGQHLNALAAALPLGLHPGATR